MPSKWHGQWRVFRFERPDGKYAELASNHLAPDEITLPEPGYAFVSSTPMVPEGSVDPDGLRAALVAIEDELRGSFSKREAFVAIGKAHRIAVDALGQEGAPSDG